MAVADYYNVNQIAPFRSTGTLEDSTGDLEADAVVRDDDLVVSMFFRNDTGNVTAGSGATERAEGGTEPDLAVQDERATADATDFDVSFTFDHGSNAHLIYAVLPAQSSHVEVTYTNANGSRIFASTTHKGGLFALITRGTDDNEGIYDWRVSTDGANWNGGAGTNWPTQTYLPTGVTRVNDWSDKLADIMGFGNKLIVALYEDTTSNHGSTSQVRIGYSSDSGTSWTFNSGLIIPANTTPNITLVATRDIFATNSELVPALVTSENIYLLDITNNTFQAMLPEGILTGTANEALAVASASDGALYVSKATGDILRINIPSAGVVDIVNIGPHTRAQAKDSDGIISDRQGHANFIWGSDPRWLFVAYGGHASGKYGSILCFDYRTGAWHSFYKDGTADRDSTRIIGSDESDGVSRLHISTENASTAVLQMFEEPFVSAVTGATQQYRSSGYVEWAEDDLGDPHADSAILTVRVDADGLDNVSTIEGGSGTSTDIEIEYGLDGAAWNNVSTLGLFGSDDKVLYFGKTNQNTPGASEAGTPIGVSAKTFRLRAAIKRDGTSTNTPKIKEIQTEHINKGDDLNGFIIAIDVGATALDQQVNPEVVLDRIDTIKKAITSVALEFGQETDGSNTTYYVEHVRKGQFDSEGVLPQGVSIGAVTERTVNIGTVVLYLEERIDV